MPMAGTSSAMSPRGFFMSTSSRSVASSLVLFRNKRYASDVAAAALVGVAPAEVASDEAASVENPLPMPLDEAAAEAAAEEAEAEGWEGEMARSACMTNARASATEVPAAAEPPLLLLPLLEVPEEDTTYGVLVLFAAEALVVLSVMLTRMRSCESTRDKMPLEGSRKPRICRTYTYTRERVFRS